MKTFKIYESTTGQFYNKRRSMQDKKLHLDKAQIDIWLFDVINKIGVENLESSFPDFGKFEEDDEKVIAEKLTKFFEYREKKTATRRLSSETTPHSAADLEKIFLKEPEDLAFKTFMADNQEKISEMILKAFHSGRDLDLKLKDRKDKPTAGSLLSRMATASGQEWCETQGFKTQSIITAIPLVIQGEGKIKAISVLREISRELNPAKAPNEASGVKALMYELIGDIEHLDSRITKVGSIISNNKIVAKLLAEDELDKFKSNCKSLDVKLQNKTLEEHQLYLEKSAGRNWGNFKGRGRGESFKGKGRAQGSCHYCKKKGHFINNCLKRKYEDIEQTGKWLKKAD